MTRKIKNSLSVALMTMALWLLASCAQSTRGLTSRKATGKTEVKGQKTMVSSTPASPTTSLLSPSDRLRYQYFLYEGIAQQGKGNYAAAFDLINHARTINPDAAEVYYYLAAYYIDMDDDSTAQAYFEKAVELAPANDTYVEKVGQMYINQRKYAEAIDIYERLFESNRKRYDVLQLLLQLYAVQNNQEQMLHTLERMEVLDGGNEQISFSKMQIYEQQGKKDKAFAELKQLVDKHPNDLNYQVMFGNWLLQNNQAEEAVKIYRRVLKDEPDNTMAQMSMLDYYRAKDMSEEADVLLMQLLKGKKTPDSEKQTLMRQYVVSSVKANTDSAKVLSVFDEVLQASPTTELLLMKASYMDMVDMPKDSINRVLQQALLIEPDHEGVRLQLIQNMWDQQNYSRVIAMSLAGQAFNPDEMLFYYFEGFAHFMQDDHDHALEAFQKGTAQINDDSNPDIVSDFYSMMGDILHEKGQTEEAFAAYDSCLQWKPDNIGALNNYAYYLSLQNRDLKRAEQMSLKTVKAEPASSTYLDTYAWILFMEKRYEEAKEYIDQALANDAEVSAVIVEHAGDIYAMCGDIPKAMEFWLKAKERGSDSTTLPLKIEQKKYIKEP